MRQVPKRIRPFAKLFGSLAEVDPLEHYVRLSSNTDIRRKVGMFAHGHKQPFHIDHFSN
jgi:hypothetical protein